jgi:uncharacterized membrane protein YphA (DoxX/SURF4 family)
MNIVLLTLQISLALAFVARGADHVRRHDAANVQPWMRWVNAIPRPLLTLIGVCEILGGIGLVLPALTHILPWLTPLAGALLAVMMLLAAVFHFGRREYSNIVVNLVLLALAGLVAYGRFAAGL